MADHVVTLADEADLEGFRRGARACLARGIEPAQVQWQVAARAEEDLFGDASNEVVAAEPSETANAPRVSVPAHFLALCERVVLHADEGRFGLLYRSFWRLAGHRQLLQDPLDPDVLQAETMARAVRRDMHKMTAFVRFRPLTDEGSEAVQHVAWFEPEHHIVEATASFFARRFAQMQWAILTPERCVRWDGNELTFGPGANRDEAPPADAAEQLWLTYYSSIFNPARLKLAMMRREMPRRYWKNLPEAVLIHPLAAGAQERNGRMVEQAPTEPARRRPAASSVLAMAARPIVVHAPGSLAELHDATQHCRECPIGATATQAVNGEGRQGARLMLVGEQPGDREDLDGRPFVGPAGQLLDKALAKLGWPREQLFLTNAVRHFKYELRGKRRIHKTPAQREAAACLHWLESEIALVRPRALIALGATAARALLGREVAPMKERGRWFVRPDGLRVLVTLHPSACCAWTRRTAPRPSRRGWRTSIARRLTPTPRWNNIVITMKSIHLVIRQIGNSHGFVIPKPVLAQLGFEGEAEMSVEGDALILRKPARHVRAGWAEAARQLAAYDDDALVIGEFGNEGDSELAW